MKYAILISTGREYSRKDGWDDLHDTRAEAESAAQRAGGRDGWSAKVLELTESEAAVWGMSYPDLLAQQQDSWRAPLNRASDWDSYSVEGEPGTWTRHQRLEDAIAQAKSLGVSVVWGSRREWHRGQSGVEKRVVWSA